MSQAQSSMRLPNQAETSATKFTDGHVRYMACHLAWMERHKRNPELVTPELADIGDRARKILDTVPGEILTRGFLQVLTSGLHAGRPMGPQQWQSVLDAAEDL